MPAARRAPSVGCPSKVSACITALLHTQPTCKQKQTGWEQNRTEQNRTPGWFPNCSQFSTKKLHFFPPFANPFPVSLLATFEDDGVISRYLLCKEKDWIHLCRKGQKAFCKYFIRINCLSGGRCSCGAWRYISGWLDPYVLREKVSSSRVDRV